MVRTRVPSHQGQEQLRWYLRNCLALRADLPLEVSCSLSERFRPEIPEFSCLTGALWCAHFDVSVKNGLSFDGSSRLKFSNSPIGR